MGSSRNFVLENDQIPKLLSGWLKEAGVSISPGKKQQILKYLDELIDWNQRVNLVAKAPAQEILRKHFIDSISISSLVPKRGGVRLMDVGTGAGFPGLVLKIIRPDIYVYLLESSKKKCFFLEHIVSILNLDEVGILNGRAESFGHVNDYRETCNVVTCRAVSHLSVISEYSFPFLKKGGLFIAQKGPAGISEFEETEDAVRTLGGKLFLVKEIVLPCKMERRVILVFKKNRETPRDYPRRNGVPAKCPLHLMLKGRFMDRNL